MKIGDKVIDRGRRHWGIGTVTKIYGDTCTVDFVAHSGTSLVTALITGSEQWLADEDQNKEAKIEEWLIENAKKKGYLHYRVGVCLF